MANTQSPLEFLPKIRAFANGGWIQVLGEAVEEAKQTAIELNQEQMYAGLRNDGSEISPFYTANTIREKRKRGQSTDRVTLNDLGNFYNLMYLEVKGNEYRIDSRDSKAADLKTKYKETIFGLTERSKMTFSEVLQPIYNRKARKRLDLP